MRAALLGLGVLVANLVIAPGASAFCRTTTCNPNNPKEGCEKDENDCVVSGKPLSWRSSCVTVGVHRAGAPLNGFSYDDVASIVEQAFGAWMAVDCGDNEGPSIDVQFIGPIECGVSEYNSKVGNANIVLFREEEWPHIGGGNAIGLTTTRFDTETGALWDADMELNGYSGNLSIGEPSGGTSDLLSVITHEAGHFFGLSHSLDDAATMKYIYNPAQDGTSFRSLAPDDEAGICAVYPPGRKPATTSCENRHGFSEQCAADQPPPNESEGCGCRLNTRSASETNAALASVLLLLGAARRRRGLRSRRPSCNLSE
jgi:Matrixin